MSSEWRCYLCGEPLQHIGVLVPVRKGARKQKPGPGLVCPTHGVLAYVGPEPNRKDVLR